MLVNLLVNLLERQALGIEVGELVGKAEVGELVGKEVGIEVGEFVKQIIHNRICY